MTRGAPPVYQGKAEKNPHNLNWIMPAEGSQMPPTGIAFLIAGWEY